MHVNGRFQVAAPIGTRVYADIPALNDPNGVGAFSRARTLELDRRDVPDFLVVTNHGPSDVEVNTGTVTGGSFTADQAAVALAAHASITVPVPGGAAGTLEELVFWADTTGSEGASTVDFDFVNITGMNGRA
jgi:hypothetical protein